MSLAFIITHKHHCIWTFHRVNSQLVNVVAKKTKTWRYYSATTGWAMGCCNLCEVYLSISIFRNLTESSSLTAGRDTLGLTELVLIHSGCCYKISIKINIVTLLKFLYLLSLATTCIIMLFVSTFAVTISFPFTEDVLNTLFWSAG